MKDFKKTTADFYRNIAKQDGIRRTEKWSEGWLCHSATQKKI
ncbi:MAG: hypothetical protein PUK80_01735 [Firmicutes bacterium]|nr:hypothetical protein [Bacillota bacterium]